MLLGIKGKIVELVKDVRKSGRARLADCIEQNWQKSALAYSEKLNQWTPTKPMEKELAAAFGKELERLGITGVYKTDILDSIKKRRVLQTAPHLGATESPRMLAINWLGSLGVPKDEYYVVGMFSGIPFSNNSRPGRINMSKEKSSESINLFPSNLQDGLVFRSTIGEKLLETFDQMPLKLDKITKFFPLPRKGSSYTKWALIGCAHMEKKIIGKNDLVYLDINEVVANYLAQALSNRFHIMHKILFDPKIRKEFAKSFGNEIMFYAPVMDGKYEKINSIKFSEISVSGAVKLIKELKTGRLCPALLPVFMSLAFLNDFKCFGSFRQVEYLPEYQAKLAKLSFMKPYEIEKIPTSNLTTGGFKDKLFPTDIVLGKKFKANPKTLFGELLLEMKNVILEG